MLCFWRWYFEVSPWRTWTSIFISPPIRSNRKSMSRFSARSGVIYNADIPARSSSGRFRIWWNTGNIALSVLPLPVGAMSSRFWFFSSLGMVRTCGSVGLVNPILERIACISGCSLLKISDMSLETHVSYCFDFKFFITCVDNRHILSNCRYNCWSCAQQKKLKGIHQKYASGVGIGE